MTGDLLASKSTKNQDLSKIRKDLKQMHLSKYYLFRQLIRDGLLILCSDRKNAHQHMLHKSNKSDFFATKEGRLD